MPQTRAFRPAVARLGAGLALAFLAAAASAAPYIAGPSMVRANEAARFDGRGFAANRAVTVVVTSPSGSEAHHSAVTDANGRLRYTATGTERGAHALKVLNDKGKPVAASIFNVLE